MRVFLDSNVLFTAAHNPKRKAALVITLGSAGCFHLATSAYAKEEARRNRERKFPDCLPAFSQQSRAIRLVGDHTSVTGLPMHARPRCCSPATSATSAF
jgi:predicted nucleic acid-binding protein